MKHCNNKQSAANAKVKRNNKQMICCEDATFSLQVHTLLYELYELYERAPDCVVGMAYVG